MVGLSIKFSDIKSLFDLSVLLVIPLFVAAYSLQFGTFSNPGEASAMSIFGLVWSLLGDCVCVLAGLLVVFCILIFIDALLGAVEFRVFLPVIGMLALSIGLAVLLAIHLAGATLVLNQLWFIALIAAGFSFLRSETKETSGGKVGPA
jgi:hypothetical protein